MPLQSIRRENCQSPQPMSTTLRKRCLRKKACSHVTYGRVCIGKEPSPEPYSQAFSEYIWSKLLVMLVLFFLGAAFFLLIAELGQHLRSYALPVMVKKTFPGPPQTNPL